MSPRRSAPSADEGSVPMLEPRAAAFGTTDGWSDCASEFAEGPDEEAVGSRRAINVALGLVAMCGLVIALVVTLWPQHDDRSTLPIRGPVTSVPATSVPATITTQPPAVPSSIAPTVPPGYVVDAPAGYRATAYQYNDVDVVDERSPSDLQLWAAAGSSRTTGRWFILQAAQGVNTNLVLGGKRIAVGDRAGLLTTSVDGIVELQYPVTSGVTSAVITANGFTTDELVQLAASVAVDDAGIATVTAPVDLVNVVHSRSFRAVGPGFTPLLNLVGGGTSAQYQPSDPDAPAIDITVSHPPIEMQSLLPYLLFDEHDEDIDGQTFAIGSVLWSTDPADSVSLATRRHSGVSVTVQTTMSGDQLHGVLASLRLADADEWAQLLSDGQQAQTTTPVSATPPAPPHFVAVAHNAPDTPQWSVAIEPDQGLIRLLMENSGTESPLDLSTPILSYVSTDLTLFVVAIEQDTGATTFRLTTPIETRDAPLQPVGSLMAAATPLAEITPYTAEVVDADGVVLASVTG